MKGSFAISAQNAHTDGVKSLRWGIAGIALILTAAHSGASDTALPSGPSSQPAGAVDPTDLYQIAKDVFDTNAPPEVAAQYEFPDKAQFEEFAARLQAAIDGDSLADLAAYEPQARAVLAVLRLAPDYSNYADWLEARLQEIEAAGQIEEKTPPASAQTSPPVPPPALLSPPIPSTPNSPFPSGPSPQGPASAEPIPPSGARAAPAPAPSPRSPSLPAPPSQLSSARHPELNIPYLDLWLRRVRNRPRPENAASLMPRLRAAFTAEGVSPDLAWLAEAESSLDPQASNPSGARGLFQLKAATAREMGLRTILPDQRTDPDKSAHAAARYLRTLERHFGSWPLAIAAFNAGEGRVARELAARRATDYAGIASALPAGTRMYVPEVCALIEQRTGTAPQDIPLPRG